MIEIRKETLAELEEMDAVELKALGGRRSKGQLAGGDETRDEAKKPAQAPPEKITF